MQQVATTPYNGDYQYHSSYRMGFEGLTPSALDGTNYFGVVLASILFPVTLPAATGATQYSGTDGSRARGLICGYSDSSGWTGFSPVYWTVAGNGTISGPTRLLNNSNPQGQANGAEVDGNGLGHVVGQYDVSGALKPFVWSTGFGSPNAVLLELGSHNLGSNFTNGVGDAVNASGVVAGHLWNGDGTGAVVTWTPSDDVYTSAWATRLAEWDVDRGGTVAGITSDGFIGGYGNALGEEAGGRPFVFFPGAEDPVLFIGSPGDFGPPSQFQKATVSGSTFYSMVGIEPHPWVWVSDGTQDASGAFDLDAVLKPGSPWPKYAYPTGLKGITFGGYGHYTGQSHNMAVVTDDAVGASRLTVDSLTLNIGGVTRGDAESLQTADGDRYILHKDYVPSPSSPQIKFVVDCTSATGDPDGLFFRTTCGYVSASTYEMKVEVYDYNEDAYVLKDTYTTSGGTSPDLSKYQLTRDVDLTDGGSTSKYFAYSGGLYHAKARVSVKQTGFVPITAWKFVFEQANFIVTAE